MKGKAVGSRQYAVGSCLRWVPVCLQPTVYRLPLSAARGRRQYAFGGWRVFCLLLTACCLLLAAPDAEAVFSKGVQAYAKEDYEHAMKWFEQATEIAPESSKYHLWLGRTAGRRAQRVSFFRAMGLAKQARTEFERAVELDNSSLPALSDLMDYYLNAPGVLGGGEDKAKGIAARLAELNPAEGHRAQAQIFAKRKDYYPAAEREFRKALELEPNKPGRLLDLASFLSERGRHQEADALFDQAAKQAPDSPDYLFARGQALARSKRDPQRARELLERYLHSPRQPEDPPPSEVQELLKKLTD